jgi:hypothetical protein
VSGFTVFVVVYALVQVTLPSAMANNKELLKLLKEVTAPLHTCYYQSPLCFETAGHSITYMYAIECLLIYLLLAPQIM